MVRIGRRTPGRVNTRFAPTGPCCSGPGYTGPDCRARTLCSPFRDYPLACALRRRTLTASPPRPKHSSRPVEISVEASGTAALEPQETLSKIAFGGKLLSGSLGFVNVTVATGTALVKPKNCFASCGEIKNLRVSLAIRQHHQSIYRNWASVVGLSYVRAKRCNSYGERHRQRTAPSYQRGCSVQGKDSGF